MLEVRRKAKKKTKQNNRIKYKAQHNVEQTKWKLNSLMCV